MPEDNVTLIREGYDAYKRKDFPAIMALLDPEIEAYQTDAVPWGGSYKGLAEFGQFMGKLTSYVDTEVIPEEIVEAGDNVVMIGRSRGTVKANGRAFDIRAIHVWRMRDGKAIRLEVYLDTPAQQEALKP